MSKGSRPRMFDFGRYRDNYDNIFDNTGELWKEIPTNPIPTPNIICPKCGHDTGLTSGPLLMVIQPPGFRCQNCGTIIIHSTEATC
jgi:DNA-directed RNA polymerase subunit RPC12/RpoP